MRHTKLKNILASLFLVAGTIVSVALAAGTQGSVSDPLVTLSYLNDVAVPDIMKQVDQKITEREDELARKLQEASGGGAETFAVVEAADGQTLTFQGGAQVVLRAGTVSSVSPMVDVTTGETLYGNLAANHLYMATSDGQTVTAAGAATLLVMGSWS